MDGVPWAALRAFFLRVPEVADDFWPLGIVCDGALSTYDLVGTERRIGPLSPCPPCKSARVSQLVAVQVLAGPSPSTRSLRIQTQTSTSFLHTHPTC